MADEGRQDIEALKDRLRARLEAMRDGAGGASLDCRSDAFPPFGESRRERDPERRKSEASGER